MIFLDKLRSGRREGFTLMELLISVVITGILVTAALAFFSGVHNQSLTQKNVSEMQDMSRATLMELKKGLRMAGYKLGGHPPYEIFGSTLGVYSSQTQAIDTTWYYLEEFTDWEYASLPDLPEGRKLWKLMRKDNSSPPEIYSDYIVGIRYTVIDSVNVDIRVTSQSPRKDMDWKLNNGYRTFSVEERVRIRNAG